MRRQEKLDWGGGEQQRMRDGERERKVRAGEVELAL